MRLSTLVLIATLSCVPLSAAAQMDGYLDLDADVERQIATLEQIVGGDASARNQAVVLQWLIELYTLQGRNADVAHCYDRILRFFPNDVGTLNAYGRFLMDTVGDYARADSILYDAYAWGKAIDARALDMGQTYALRAELMRRSEDFDTALHFTDLALELLSTEGSTGVLRTRARTLTALERFDDAAETWLELIGIDRAANLEDINELKVLVPLTSRIDAGDVEKRIAAAVTDYRTRQEARIELEGGRVLTFPSEDGTTLEATLRKADGPGAVLFVHDLGETRTAFTPYGQLLYIDGISSLAVDLRGHGGSRTDSTLTVASLSPTQLDRLPDDVVAAYRCLQDTLGLDDAHIAIVTAGAAAGVVETALYRGRINAPVVHLSPVFPRDDRDIDTALSFHADRPLLILSSREDLESLRAIRRFDTGRSRSDLTTRMYRDSGHGLETLRRVPEALEEFQEWLRRTVGSS